MPVSESTFKRVALEDDSGQWELVCGQLRRKPAMTMEHNSVMSWLGVLIQNQLNRAHHQIRVNSGHIRAASSYLIPDVAVIPTALAREFSGRENELELYSRPLPFVAEIWSRSTGEYDVESKFPEYRGRGDLEIWRVHPYEHTVTAWRRQPDGSYTESFFREGVAEIASLPGVRIPLAELFDLPG